MLKPHEQTHADRLVAELRYMEVLPPSDLDDRPVGPFARTLEAIDAYRRVSRHTDHDDLQAQTALEGLSDLICLYAVGIVRGDGEGITPWPQPAATGAYSDDESF